MKVSSKDGSKMTTVIASPGQGPDRSTEVSYSDAKVIYYSFKYPFLLNSAGIYFDSSSDIFFSKCN